MSLFVFFRCDIFSIASVVDSHFPVYPFRNKLVSLLHLHFSCLFPFILSCQLRIAFSIRYCPNFSLMPSLLILISSLFPTFSVIHLSFNRNLKLSYLNSPWCRPTYCSLPYPCVLSSGLPLPYSKCFLLSSVTRSLLYLLSYTLLVLPFYHIISMLPTFPVLTPTTLLYIYSLCCPYPPLDSHALDFYWWSDWYIFNVCWFVINGVHSYNLNLWNSRSTAGTYWFAKAASWSAISLFSLTKDISRSIPIASRFITDVSRDIFKSIILTFSQITSRCLCLYITNRISYYYWRSRMD